MPGGNAFSGKSTLQERHELLTTILDDVYIDMKDSKSIVSVKVKPAFQAVIELCGQYDQIDQVMGLRTQQAEFVPDH